MYLPWALSFQLHHDLRANTKQPTVNDGHNKLRGRFSAVILTSTHHWILWAHGGQLSKMSVLSYIYPLPVHLPPCFVTLLFHLHTTRECFDVCCQAVQRQMRFLWHYLFHFSYCNSLRGPECVCSLPSLICFLHHVRRPSCLWGSESDLMLKTQKTLINHNSWLYTTVANC